MGNSPNRFFTPAQQIRTGINPGIQKSLLSRAKGKEERKSWSPWIQFRQRRVLIPYIQKRVQLRCEWSHRLPIWDLRLSRKRLLWPSISSLWSQTQGIDGPKDDKEQIKIHKTSIRRNSDSNLCEGARPWIKLQHHQTERFRHFSKACLHGVRAHELKSLRAHHSK